MPQAEFARWESRDALIRLWSEVFGDSPETLKFFFDTVFSPDQTLTLSADGQIVSALYLLPATFFDGTARKQAHYIYAAATAPAYRSRGYMDLLLQAAARVGEKRGDAYSILLPSEESLYAFYAGKGYQTAFSERVQTVSREPSREGLLRMADLDEICAIRSGIEWCCAKDGVVLWSRAHVALAQHFYRVYGGSVWTDGEAYAFCEPIENGTMLVRELFAKEGKTAHALIPKICASFSAQTYQFHLPEALSRGEGNLRHHGMLKPLGTSPFPKGASAYLGLALE